jgi:hypothetical protein
MLDRRTLCHKDLAYEQAWFEQILDAQSANLSGRDKPRSVRPIETACLSLDDPSGNFAARCRDGARPESEWQPTRIVSQRWSSGAGIQTYPSCFTVHGNAFQRSRWSTKLNKVVRRGTGATRGSIETYFNPIPGPNCHHAGIVNVTDQTVENAFGLDPSDLPRQRRCRQTDENSNHDEHREYLQQREASVRKRPTVQGRLMYHAGDNAGEIKGPGRCAVTIYMNRNGRNPSPHRSLYARP